jgi:hypothetical protein
MYDALGFKLNFVSITNLTLNRLVKESFSTIITSFIYLGK